MSTELGLVPPEIAELIRLEVVATDLSKPLGLEVAPGDRAGRLYIVEQTGRVRLLEAGKVSAVPFLDVSKLITLSHNEQGLLGLAFHPRFEVNGRLFINYTDTQGRTQVVEYRRDPANPGIVDAASATIWMTLEQPWRNHNGGNLEFGPDGALYIGTGDGGAANDPRGAAQDPDSRLGKMLRLDVDEPLAKPVIVARGLRNPWQYHFDSATGDLYIADVGQDAWEWVFVVPAGELQGKNFGWNVVEGMHCFRGNKCRKDGFHPPVIEYSHKDGCSITGGQVYRGKSLPELRGVYVYADFCTGLLRSFRWSKDGVRDHWDLKPVLDPDFVLATISAFGADADGELYLLSLDGDIYKLARK